MTSDLRLFCLESDLHLPSTLDLLDALNCTVKLNWKLKIDHSLVKHFSLQEIQI